MALQLSYDAFGVNFPKAYAFVASGSWSKATLSITADLAIYASVETRDAGAPPLFSSSVTFPIDLTLTQNIFTQAYNAIKARPEFAGAEDV